MTHADLRALRAVIHVLAGVWIEDRARFLPGWHDARVAEVAGVSMSRAAEVRRGAYGAEAEASDLWRLRQVFMLLAQHFDATAEQDARDAVAWRVGPDDLAVLIESGVAPAGGAWDPEWSDDRVAELVGLDPGLVHAARESQAWVPPEARAEARRQAHLVRLGTTRAARMLRLADELNPMTRRPYTSEELLVTLIGAGEIDPRTAGARRRELTWIDSTIQVGRAWLDAEGRPRSARAIAAELQLAPGTVLRVLARFEGQETAAEGRPTLLTAELCERLERADPRRADLRPDFASPQTRAVHARFGGKEARPIYPWLTAWLWPEGEAPSLRTIKGWRATGSADVLAGRDTLPARFERAVSNLIDRAPSAPILPGPAELAEVAKLPTHQAADLLGVTPKQYREARRLVRNPRP